jgi:hypothetical protein
MIYSKPSDQYAWIGRIITFINDLALVKLISVDPDGISCWRDEARNTVFMKTKMSFA